MADSKKAEIDVNTGQLINPHNPQFITKAPWYVQQGEGATLDHQKSWRAQPGQGSLQAVVRGLKGDVKTKFVKGACENCGALTHQKKDCTERPRKVPAKYSGTSLASDEVLVNPENVNYVSKRDVYQTYDPEQYVTVIKEYEDLEKERLAQKEQRAQEVRAQRIARKRKRMEEKQARKEGKGQVEDSDSDSSDEESSDVDTGEKVTEFADGGVVGTKDDATRTSTRNLRIREDTAKYLLNLDLDSAFYDPKTRSMRDDPFKDVQGK